MVTETKSFKYYDRFYATGGWKYRPWREKMFLKRRIIKPLLLEKGRRVLEIGCGMGYHSHLLHKLGFTVVGVDNSEVGIAYAREHFKGPRYLAADAAELGKELERESFDIIYVRGMSWYHYELTGVNKHGIDVPAATGEFFTFLKPGGVFVLQIKTDFSGSKTKDAVHYNSLNDYISLFERFGKIDYISDWRGRILQDDAAARESGRSIIIATRKEP